MPTMQIERASDTELKAVNDRLKKGRRMDRLPGRLPVSCTLRFVPLDRRKAKIHQYRQS